MPEPSPTMMMPIISSQGSEAVLPPILTEIQSRDVLLGKQKNCHRHPGTVAFRVLIAVKTEEYATAKRPRKSLIIEEVANQVSSGSGRFLKRQDWSSRDSTEGQEKWCRVSQKEIREKVSNSFRDRIKSLKKKVVGNHKRERNCLFQKLANYFLDQQNKQRTVTYEDILQKVLHDSEQDLPRNSCAVSKKEEDLLPACEHVVAGGGQHWCPKAGKDPSLATDQQGDRGVFMSSFTMESQETDDSKDRACVSFSQSGDGYLVITPPTGAVWNEYRLKMQMDESDWLEWMDDLDDLIASPDN